MEQVINGSEQVLIMPAVVVALSVIALSVAVVIFFKRRGS